MSLPQTTLADSSTVLAGAAGVHVLHSQHYHASLLRALREAQGIDAAILLTDGVAACGSGIVAPPPVIAEDGAWGWIAERFRRSGLGRLEVAGLGAAGTGTAVLHGSHFATAWRARYAMPRMPVCAAPAALLARLLSDSAGADRSAAEVRCAARGDSACTFEVTASVGPASASSVPRLPVTREAAPEVPESGVTLLDTALVADAEGVINAPAGVFAGLPAEFYAAVCRIFEVEVPRVRGAKFGSLPGILLTEAAHWNGFQLFGEILASAEWREQVEPGLGTETERVRALLEVPERLGWGAWEIRSFVAGERIIVRVHESYEAIGHERLFGRAQEPRCVVARGAAAAVMNVLYRAGDGLGGELTTSRYNALFRSPHTFRAVETRCRAQGDSFCELVANPLTV